MSFFSQIAASASKAATELGGHAKTMGNNILATENGKNMYNNTKQVFGITKERTMVLVIDPVTKFGKYAHQELVNANRNPGVPTEEAKG